MNDSGDKIVSLNSRRSKEPKIEALSPRETLVQILAMIDRGDLTISNVCCCVEGTINNKSADGIVFVAGDPSLVLLATMGEAISGLSSALCDMKPGEKS